nr:hypothetical protein SYMBAF_50404 [Serratia symbiotica]
MRDKSSGYLVWLVGIRHRDSMSTTQALAWNEGTCRPDAKGAQGGSSLARPNNPCK